MKEYGLYDFKDNEQCVFIGNVHEIAKFLKCSEKGLYSHITRHRQGIIKLLKARYEIAEIQKDFEDDFTEKEIAKHYKDIRGTIIKEFTGKNEIETLQEVILKFKIFDEFNWYIKGIVDNVISEEQWKKIPQFEYSVSNYGRVRNDKNNKIKSSRYRRWEIKKDIYKDGRRYTINIPRLEANLFIRKVESNERVTFKDGDRRNMYYKNLKILSM